MNAYFENASYGFSVGFLSGICAFVCICAKRTLIKKVSAPVFVRKNGGNGKSQSGLKRCLRIVGRSIFSERIAEPELKNGLRGNPAERAAGNDSAVATRIRLHNAGLLYPLGV